ncbi:hypothetical protein SISNIDRAFT_436281, partial [Sistotremastrum niveocremeum HHB9708]
MDRRLTQIAPLQQKDKGPAYLSLLSETLRTKSPNLVNDVKLLVRVVVTEDHVGLVVARQVLTELSKSLDNNLVDISEVKKAIINDTLEIVQPQLVSFEEQATSLRYQLADILEQEEEWSEAARVLMGISMESGNRAWPEQDRFRVYVRVVRLLLEDQDSVQAEMYYNRAALLVHQNTDKELGLMFKLCQAKISDHTRKFQDAASRYHELSWVAEIDEEERAHMLSAAVTCAVLAPAGPARSRILASLCRDERTSQLPNYNILSKMFLDHILRPSEVKEFEATLQPHQLAKIAQSSSDRLASTRNDDQSAQEPGASTRVGPSTVLDRAVLEHNVLSCSKIYSNISFSGLGALLDLTPGAAETMARKMIEQGRLRGWIDQVDKLIWFEGKVEDDDAQGKAGGLGDVSQEVEETGAPFTKGWDRQIRLTAGNVEIVVQRIL